MIRNWLFKSKEEKDKKERANKLMTEFKFLQIEHRLDAIEDKKPKEALIHVINGKLIFKPHDGEVKGFNCRCTFHMPNQNKQKEQKMSEKYLPKVGETVILKRDPALLYRDTTPKDGTEMEVVAHFNGVPVCAWMDDFSCHSDTFGTSSLRPLPLKSPKELAIEAIKAIDSDWENDRADNIYQAIADGKIPGVVLEKKKRKARVTVNGLYRKTYPHPKVIMESSAYVEFGIYVNGELIRADKVEGKSLSAYCKLYEIECVGDDIEVAVSATSADSISLKIEWVD